MREKLKRYFKYHNTHTMPYKRSHMAYIGSLAQLEAMTGKRLAESGDTSRSWQEILDCINSLSDEQAVKLYDFVIFRAENRTKSSIAH